jgi:hypothetical protein
VISVEETKSYLGFLVSHKTNAHVYCIFYYSTTQPTLKSFAPAATMFYTDIQTLRGLDVPIDYGSGVEYAQGLAEAFPHSGIQIGLWLNGTAGCQDIVDGALDEKIHELYSYLHHVDVPKIFLRLGYEFDNPSFGYSDDPALYQQAFRKMVTMCEDQLHPRHSCHDKIAFCWHSWAAPKVADVALDDFYPGDDVVDWIGISVFQQLYPWANNAKTEQAFAGGSKDQVVEVLEFAKQHDKPVMIAESTPFGGIYMDDGAYNHTPIVVGEDPWSLWFQPTLELIETYDIAMWSYINCDWNAQPMWKGVGFGDTRVSVSSEVMEHWRSQILSSSRFIHQLGCEQRHHHHHSSSSLQNTEQASLSSSSSTMMLMGWTSSVTIKVLISQLCIVVVLVIAYFLVYQALKGKNDSVARSIYGSVEEEREEKQ